MASPKAREALKDVGMVIQTLQELGGEKHAQLCTTDKRIPESQGIRKRTGESGVSERPSSRARLEADHSLPGPKDRFLHSRNGTYKPEKNVGGFSLHPQGSSARYRDPNVQHSREKKSNFPSTSTELTKWQGNLIERPNVSHDDRGRRWKSAGVSAGTGSDRRRSGLFVHHGDARKVGHVKRHAPMSADLGMTPKRFDEGSSSRHVSTAQHTSSNVPVNEFEGKDRTALGPRIDIGRSSAPVVSARGLRPPRHLAIDVMTTGERRGSNFPEESDYRTPPVARHYRENTTPASSSFHNTPSGSYPLHKHLSDRNRSHVGSFPGAAVGASVYHAPRAPSKPKQLSHSRRMGISSVGRVNSPPPRRAPKISDSGGLREFPPEPPNARAPLAPPLTLPRPFTGNVVNTGQSATPSAPVQRKQWQCDWCKRLFNQKGNLVVHIRTHTGEKPYVCNICGKAFAQMSNMKRHRKTHY
uniref:C2H2-type domain-containing protein n=1 Tax=Lotharella oceanica TaxID=641309 RepID=A0A7S2U1U8_9EUKA